MCKIQPKVDDSIPSHGRCRPFRPMVHVVHSVPWKMSSIPSYGPCRPFRSMEDVHSVLWSMSSIPSHGPCLPFRPMEDVVHSVPWSMSSIPSHGRCRPFRPMVHVAVRKVCYADCILVTHWLHIINFLPHLVTAY